MPAIDLVDVVEQRLAEIKEDEPDRTADAMYFIGEAGIWSLITVREDEEVVEYEFIETAESWKRPDAILEYNEAVFEDIEVLVIVPDQSFIEMAELVHEKGAPEVSVSDYMAMELMPTPLVE